MAGMTTSSRDQMRRPTANNNSAVRAADSLKTRGGPGRDSDRLLEIVVTKMAAQHELFCPIEGEGYSPCTRQVVTVPQLEIRDKLACSEINKLLHSYSSKTRPRQSSSNMIHIKCLTVRPDPTSDLEETSLKVSLQPIRLNIDQDTLFFIIDFFNTLVPPQVESELGKSPSPPPVPD